MHNLLAMWFTLATWRSGRAALAFTATEAVSSNIPPKRNSLYQLYIIIYGDVSFQVFVHGKCFGKYNLEAPASAFHLVYYYIYKILCSRIFAYLLLATTNSMNH